MKWRGHAYTHTHTHKDLPLGILLLRFSANFLAAFIFSYLCGYVFVCVFRFVCIIKNGLMKEQVDVMTVCVCVGVWTQKILCPTGYFEALDTQAIKLVSE